MIRDSSSDFLVILCLKISYYCLRCTTSWRPEGAAEDQ